MKKIVIAGFVAITLSACATNSTLADANKDTVGASAETKAPAQKVYCRKERAVGSNFPTKVCTTGK